jgi:hypothetical protein
MATIAEQLTSLADAKSAIKGAIISRGVPVSDTDPLRSYADKISNIGETVPDVRFGVGIGNLLGTVDADGNYTCNPDNFILDLSGVKRVGRGVASRTFSYLFNSNSKLVGVIGNDFVEATANYVFTGMCQNCSYVSVFEFNSLEVIETEYMFSNCNSNGNTKLVPHFNKLKSIKSNSNSFSNAFASPIEPDETFPLLEYVSGYSQLDGFRKIVSNDVIVFSKIKTIVGGKANYLSTLGSLYIKDVVWHFPRATEFAGYVWNIGESYTGEIHFAAANQAAIEACDGYANKWGHSGATIYFDLMLNITVNGVAYTRLKTIGGYTSWEDANGNLVYTVKTEEPSVGSVVYSDQGVTEFGTVSEVA